MAIPFLPASLISPTYNCLQLPAVNDAEKIKLENLLKYSKKHWIRRITPAELSINEITIATNNAAESYHSKLKSIIRDTDNNVGRLQLGRDISRPRKKVDIENDVRRNICKELSTHGSLFKPSAILLVRLVLTTRKILSPPTILKMKVKN